MQRRALRGVMRGLQAHCGDAHGHSHGYSHRDYRLRCYVIMHTIFSGTMICTWNTTQRPLLS
jgi:hypothetical protein